MSEPVRLEVTADDDGARVDAFIASQLDDVSRSMVQKSVRAAQVQVNGRAVKRASHIVNAGDEVSIVLPDQPTIDLEPEPIPLDIVYEDDALIIVDKPPGLVVHPAPGHASGTLLNAILYHCPDFQRPGDDPKRPGVVHRLDRDTSGLMVVAKTQSAMVHLAQQAKAHSFDRRYVALVRGEFPEDEGRINAAVGRSLSDRKRMTVTAAGGRDAITHFRVMDRFGIASQVALQLDTGRTHQIRVHLRFAQHPVLGDPVYGVTDFESWSLPDAVREALEALPGQALHAETLGVTHPESGERLTFHAPPPTTYQRALDALRKWKQTSG